MPKDKNGHPFINLLDIYKSAVNETTAELAQTDAIVRFLKSLGPDFEADASRFEHYANRTKTLLDRESGLLLGATSQVASSSTRLSYQNSISAKSSRSALSVEGKAIRKIAKQVILELKRLGSTRGLKAQLIKDFIKKNDPDCLLDITEKQVLNRVDYLLPKKKRP